jgi:hypothetical protein
LLYFFSSASVTFLSLLDLSLHTVLDQVAAAVEGKAGVLVQDLVMGLAMDLGQVRDMVVA